MSIPTIGSRGFATWLPDVLRAAGLDVYVMPGALTRSTWTSGFRMDAIVWHHTATGPRWLDGHVAALLSKGRIDLKGPLSQVGVERDGTWVIVACGRANHNGAKTAKYGNDTLGLEFYNAGDGIDPWPDAQMESGITGIAAIRNYVGRDIPLFGHKETDATRKIDPKPVAMAIVRSRVAQRQQALRQATIHAGLDHLVKTGVMEPEAAACILYRTYLGRDPESLQTIAARADQIRKGGCNPVIGELVNSAEGKRYAAFQKRLRAAFPDPA